ECGNLFRIETIPAHFISKPMLFASTLILFISTPILFASTQYLPLRFSDITIIIHIRVTSCIT
ncbi:MAG TPA: hypothetical protein PLY21_15180, partial [Spirochaetota bacterium]|nr:hypothetical protein [Spirochaetota bacterium]